MSALNKCDRLCKNHIYVIMSVFSKPGFPNRDKRTSVFPAPLEASNNPLEPSSPGSSLAVPQTPNYNKDKLQQIFKTVLEIQLSAAHSQD